MSALLPGLLSVLIAAAEAPTAPASRPLPRSPATNSLSIPATTVTNGPDFELKSIMQADDAAQELILQWNEQSKNPTNAFTAPLKATLQRRTEEKLESVRSLYTNFLARYPNHAAGHLAYGSFLGDLGEDDDMVKHWETSRKLDPNNPAAWNNLAGHYAHVGPVRTAFDYFEKAIALNPREPQYYHSLGTCVFLFRKDAREHWNIDEQAVFAKALSLYSNSLRLDSTNFILATDIAQTFYGIKPAPSTNLVVNAAAETALVQQALGAWTNALRLAGGPVETEGTLVHLFRWKLRQGRFQEAREILARIQLPVYAELKKRLERSLRDKEAGQPEKAPPN